MIEALEERRRPLHDGYQLMSSLSAAKVSSGGILGWDIVQAFIRYYPFTRVIRFNKKLSFVHVSAPWPGGADKSHAQLQV